MLISNFVEGANCVIKVPVDRSNTLQYIAKVYRAEGWGVTVNPEEKTLSFWIPKTTRGVVSAEAPPCTGLEAQEGTPTGYAETEGYDPLEGDSL